MQISTRTAQEASSVNGVHVAVDPEVQLESCRKLIGQSSVCKIRTCGYNLTVFYQLGADPLR